MAERRRKVRPKSASKWTERDREIHRSVMIEALEKFHERKKGFFGEMTPEEHVASHTFLSGWMEFWLSVKARVFGGVGGGLGKIVEVITIVFGVTMFFALFGSLFSQNVRLWIVGLLGGH